MTVATRLGLAVALAAMPLPVAAQQADDAIVVRGAQAAPADLGRQARAYGRAVEAVPVGGQLARWNRPLCPKVEGLDTGAADIVAATIVRIAREAHAQIGASGCRANLVVTFTTDARALITTIERREPELLSQTPLADRAVLRTAPLPVRWWYSTAIESEDGEPLANESPILSGLLGVPTSPNERYLDSYSSSLTDTKVRASIGAVAVLVDVGAANGYRLDAVATFVAFVALAHVRIGRPAPPTPSILALFDGERPGRPELSRWDAAYLAALYGSLAARPAAVQRGLIAASMTSTLGGDARP